MRWKTDEEKREFHDIDFGLQLVLLFMDAYSQHFFGTELTITEMIRTDEEQFAIYGADPVFRAHPWKSYHQLTQAGDLRYASLDFDQWSELLTVTERIFGVLFQLNYVVHTPGNTEEITPHVHVEVQKPYSEEMFKDD